MNDKLYIKQLEETIKRLEKLNLDLVEENEILSRKNKEIAYKDAMDEWQKNESKIWRRQFLEENFNVEKEIDAIHKERLKEEL